jgi:hypothetical protein
VKLVLMVCAVRLDCCVFVCVQELPNLRPECLRVLEVSTNFLQRCASAGLTLADIGALASRPLDALDGDDSTPSELEKACIAARQVRPHGMTYPTFQLLFLLTGWVLFQALALSH